MSAAGRFRCRDDSGLSDGELIAVVRARPPGDPEREAACEALVRRHAGIVRSCAARYRSSPEPAEDLMQAGYVGLMKAISYFDPQIGDNLAAYAQLCVSGEIKRHFRDKRWPLRVQRPAQELRLRIRGAADELTQELARKPSDAELARHLGVTEAEVTDAQLATRAFHIASLDAPAVPGDESAGSIGDLIGAEDPGLEHAVDIDAVWQHCADLAPREQRLLMMRFYGNMTQEQISAELGISQMHVSRLLARTLRYLRDQLTDAAPSEPA